MKAELEKLKLIAGAHKVSTGDEEEMNLMDRL